MDAGRAVECLPRTSTEAVEAFRTGFLAALCETKAACGLSNFDPFSTIEECVEHDFWVRFRFTSRYQLALEAVEEGYLVLDEDAARDCVAFEREGCSRVGTGFPNLPGIRDYFDVKTMHPCLTLFRYRCPPTGSRCWTPSECGPDRWCNGVRAPPMACGEGYCEPFLSAGDECDVLVNQCLDTRAPLPRLHCFPVSSSLGSDGICREIALGDPAGLGEPCHAVDQTTEPVVLVPCEIGLRCVRTSPLIRAPWECRAPPAGRDGDPCSDGRCAHGFKCNEMDVCEPWDVGPPAAPGSACVDSADLDRCTWQIGTECIGGICTETGGGVGSRCDPRPRGGRIGAYCTPPAICEGESQICVEPFANGEECLADEECASSCCDFDVDAGRPRCADASACEAREPCP